MTVMSDAQTIAVYDARVHDYADVFSRSKPDKHLRQFLNALPQAAHVLDLGCGPGNSAAMIRTNGHSVDATDASAEMVRVANETYNLVARQARFDQIEGTDIYDGIWANFSLLHADKSALPVHLAALHRALKPGGPFHIGMKLGQGTRRDNLGRFYSYYSEDELTDILKTAGFTPSLTDTGAGKGLSGNVEPWIVILSHG